MSNKFFFSLFFFSSLFITAQKKPMFTYGTQVGIQLNSAILPDIKINTSINSVLNGEDVIKGKPQFANLTFNYRFGGFVKYNHGFGFGLFEVNYTTTKIKKEVTFTPINPFGDITFFTTTLERSYSYLDIVVSYNMYIFDSSFLGLGVSISPLLSYTGNPEPNKKDYRLFINFGYQLNKKIFISTRAELGVNEVYNNSYIHHLMIPIILSYSF